MNRRAALVGAMLVALAAPVAAATGAADRFASIDGGMIDLGDLRGRPVLVVNTASLCAFAGQFDDLQALQDRYAEQGLYVLAVPSNDFNQELATGAEVKKYCAVNFDLTLPMTEITHVTGPEAHPFYARLRETEGFVPKWNFNKVLLDGRGDVVATWGSAVNPMSRPVIAEIERMLPAP